VLVRLRFSTKSPAEVTGYAVGLAQHTNQDGGVVWYGGGKLAADLTLPKLRQRWQPRSTADQRPGHDRFTAPRRNQSYRHAAREAHAATDYIRHCSRTDPARAADAAWAAADAMYVAARTLRIPALRCAADAYDRAARLPYGRLPRCTQAGDRLRLAARLIAVIGSDDQPGQVGELLISLASLVAAVADLRVAQQHAAQAKAARTAAEHLHACVEQQRLKSAQRPHRGTVRASELARNDIPARPAPDPPAPASSRSPAASTSRRSMAPRRRGPPR